MTHSLADLPGLDQAYPLAADQMDAYRQDGHILLRGVASQAEIAAYLPAIRSAVAQFNTETRPLAEREIRRQAFLQIMNLWTRDAAVRRFTLARRFAGLAAELMGVPGVRIYHDQALYKEPGGSHTPWHQDQYYWPLDTDQTITLWMPLVDVSAHMGTLTFASGSHQEGYLGKLPISEESDAVFEAFVAERGFQLAQGQAMAAGDATFHSGWTLHAAPGNDSDRAREVMTVIYFADGARLIEPDNPNRERDMERWLPGLQPGDLAASELNPQVYP
jgi:ectoine hydroxylase-related dioxygenase (phytanoyl-CoA dioxygenase family)